MVTVGLCQLTVVARQSGTRASANIVLPVATMAQARDLARAFLPDLAWADELPRRRAVDRLVGAVLLVPLAIAGWGVGRGLGWAAGAALVALGAIVLNRLWTCGSVDSSGLLIVRRGVAWASTYVIDPGVVHVFSRRIGPLAHLVGRSGMSLHFLDRGRRSLHLVLAPHTSVRAITDRASGVQSAR